jgi:hypothetical protein
MASSSPRSQEAVLTAQVRALAKQVRKQGLQIAELAKNQTVPSVFGGGWERPAARSRRVGDSIRTIERQVAAGTLEKRTDGRKVYVRDKPDQPAAKKRRGRRPKADTVIAAPVITDPAGPLFPFRSAKDDGV